MSETFQLLDDTDKSNRGMPPLILHGELSDLRGLLTRYNKLGYGVFATVNKTNGQGRTDADIVALRSLYVDLDNGLPPAWPLTPSLVVQSSPGKYYAFWHLTPNRPVETHAKQYLGVLRAAVKRLGGDTNAQDLSRVLRVPGFINNKPGRGQPTVTAVSSVGNRYTLDDLQNAFGFEAAPELVAPAQATSNQRGVVDALLKGIAKFPPPLAGQRLTNEWMYKTASWACRNLGLTEAEVLDTFLYHVDGIAATEAEIATTVRNAARYARGYVKANKTEVGL